MKELDDESSGYEISLLGMKINLQPAKQAVVSVVDPGMWAERNNVRPGDILATINELPLGNYSFEDILAMMRTRKQRPLECTFQRPSVPDETAEDRLHKRKARHQRSVSHRGGTQKALMDAPVRSRDQSGAQSSSGCFSGLVAASSWTRYLTSGMVPDTKTATI